MSRRTSSGVASYSDGIWRVIDDAGVFGRRAGHDCGGGAGAGAEVALAVARRSESDRGRWCGIVHGLPWSVRDGEVLGGEGRVWEGRRYWWWWWGELSPPESEEADCS